MALSSTCLASCVSVAWSAWRAALGLDYTYNPRWRFQAGLAFDESAMPDDTFDSSIPTSDATWVSMGIRYQYSERLSIGLGYAHVFLEERAIVPSQSALGDRLDGDMEVNMDVLGVQFNWQLM